MTSLHDESRKYFHDGYTRFCTNRSMGDHNDDPAPLHTAAQNGDIEAIRTLVKCGYGINSLHDGGAPLHFAAESDQVDSIKTLVELGADIDCKDGNGKTPLYCAAVSGQTKAIKVLKELNGKMA